MQEKIVKIWLPLPFYKPYSYKVLENMAGFSSLQHGSFVRVPLSSRLLLGVVFEENEQRQKGNFIKHDDGLPSKKLKKIDFIYDTPPLSKEFMDFLAFFSSYTMTPFGLALRMALRGSGTLEEDMPLSVLVKQKDDYKGKTEAQKRVLECFLEKTHWFKSDLIKAAKVSPSVIDTLYKQEIVTYKEQEAPSLAPLPVPLPKNILLEDAQKKASLALKTLIAEKKHLVALLYGVTGSGKTQVYFDVLAQILEKGQQVLILLPEIALTQQFLDKFKQCFGGYPAQWHSGLTSKQREKIWRQVKNGKIKVLVGARSALFLPFKNLGLIIIDEEHDQSYKQEENIYYNARDMAVALGYFCSLPVILASATPSLESFVNAKNKKYHLIELKTRYHLAAFPELKLINKPMGDPYLSKELLKALEENLLKKEQSLLFLNRRGYSPFTMCRKCGYKFQCRQCSSYLVAHHHFGYYKCHQCEETEEISTLCPQCGESEALVHLGVGVERLQETLKKLFPEARFLIFSSDLLNTTRKLQEELQRVEAGEVDIIIGTQMVTKGHHFPKLSLVGVIDADFALKNGDFRASERLFQLLSQVTGRAGREGLASLGLIQTDCPNHPVLQAIFKNDPMAFYSREAQERECFAYPPFGRMAALIISGENVKDAQDYAYLLRQKAPPAKAIEVWGPTEATLSLIRGFYRFRILIRGSKTSNLQKYISLVLKKAGKAKKGIFVHIDIDPQSFL